LELNKFIDFCCGFWNAIYLEIAPVKKYVAGINLTEKIRSKEGGCILFRPVALVPFVKAVLRIKEESPAVSFRKICKKMNLLPLSLKDPCWEGILWDNNNNNMIMNNNRVVELMLLLKFDSKLLNEKQNNELISKYAKAKKITETDAAKMIISWDTK